MKGNIGSIDIEDQNTWPVEVLAELESHFDVLHKNALSEMHINKLCEVDAHYQRNRPEAIHTRYRNDVLGRLNTLLQPHCITAYHCSRLTDFEVEDVRLSGLNTLELDFALNRIARLESQGMMPAAVAEKLRAKNAIGNRHGDRLAQVCFMLSTHSLRNEDDTAGLLSHWGGEALYWAYEHDPEVSAVLRSVGSPCIVQVQIPVPMLETYDSAEEMLLTEFLASRDATFANAHPQVGRIRSPLGPEQIKAIHKLGEPEFESLTEHEKWRRKLVPQRIPVTF